MASLRPYGYPGGTLYTSASSSSGKGLAMYYDGWFNQCGWAALFYNNTGKDIIITKLCALAGANPSAFTAKFECSDVGTSAPNTISCDSLTDVADVTISYCGKTVSSWVGADANIKITKGHYFIVGLRSINAGGDHWFNLARTGNNANSCPYNCYFMQKNSSNGPTTWTRDWSSVWRYQTPEIMVDYKDAAIQVYVDESTSKSDSFYMGAVKSYSLADCNTTSVSCSNGHIKAAVSSDKKTLYVWANLLDSTQTATITVYGYNSSATLTITAYPSKITSCDITASVLKPGQSTNFSYSHEGVSDNSLNSYNEYGNLDPIGQMWRVDYDQIEVDNNPNTNIVKVEHIDSSNSGKITFNAITDESNSVADESVMTITARVATDYNNDDTYRFPIGLSKSDTVKFKHWLTSDINVSLTQNLLKLSKDNYLTILNKTNLTNIDENVPGDFNSVTVSFDNDDPLSEYLAFRKSGEIYKNPVTFSKNETVDIVVENDISTDQTFSDEHILNIRLTNDVVVTTTLKFKTAVVYDFDFIYPKNTDWDNPRFSGSTDSYWINDESIARETVAKLPVYRTGNAHDSQKISVFNYPIQIQMPTLKQGDTPNTSSTPDFKVSLHDCFVLLNDEADMIKINLATLGRYDSAINASGHTADDSSANERILLINCDIPVSADNIRKENVAKITRWASENTLESRSEVLTDVIYDDGDSDNLSISFTAINDFGTGSTVLDTIALVTDSDEILWSNTNPSGFDGTYEMTVRVEGNSKLKIKIYNSEGKSVWAEPKISNIVINNLSNDEVPGILLTDKYSMILGILLTRVNDEGKENVGNNKSVKYDPVQHRLKIHCNVFNECDLTTDRTNQKIQYKNQTIIDDGNSSEYTYKDYTLRRAICDASRIGYMYGRLTTDETLKDETDPNNNNIYLDDFEAIDSHFINADKAETGRDYGLPLSDSRLYLDSLLSAMNDLLVNIKDESKCKSDNSLKNKLKTPRRLVAVNYPIMWDDYNVLNHTTESLSDAYKNNLTLNSIYNVYGYESMKATLETKTASPFKELLDCVSSFQDSVPLANVSIIDNEGNICPVSFYFDNNTPNNTADDKIFKLGVIDY